VYVNMNNEKVVGGAVLLVIAIYVFITISDFTTRFVGGAVIGIVGLVTLLSGLKKK